MRPNVYDLHFDVLGVTRYSTKDEIKKAYRDEIKKWHPDKFPDQPNKILEALDRSKNIIEAFSLLKNYDPPKPKITTNSSSTFTRKKRSSYPRQTSKPKANRINIEAIIVKSSNLHSVAYDKALKILQVEFLSGSVYQYCNVPNFIYLELMQSSSKGRYFNSKIAFCYKFECV